MDNKEKMVQLVEKLNKAAEAYYNKDTEIISNLEYDILFDELKKLEEETGIVLPDSPTKRVGYDVVEGLTKVEHETPALSLDKTKDVDALKAWLADKTGILSWKMDGLTIVATYENGKLSKAVTRGNGLIGEDITHNAKHFNGLPKSIPLKNKLVVRGEAAMTYSEFDRVNEACGGEYKNPRNLASGTVRSLDASLMKDRKVTFYAFELLNGYDSNSWTERLDKLSSLGFNTVEHTLVTKDTLEDTIRAWEKAIPANDYPTDGLVLEYDDVAYGASLGTTGHHPRYGMAFKWRDEIVETEMIDVEWSASRTGLLNPVAIFAPVEIEGTTVSRASIHNLSVMKGLGLHKGDKVGVYKANMIIPQIAENLSSVHTGPKFTAPDCCPVCGAKTVVLVSKDDIETLACSSEGCPAKKVGMFERFVDRDAMNIEGMSTATIELLIDHHFMTNPYDLYGLKGLRDEVARLEGFGKKSSDNLISAIEKSCETTFERFLYSLGIPEIGRSQSKEIRKYILNNKKEGTIWETFMDMCDTGFDFTQIPNFGQILDGNLHKWYENMESWVTDLAGILTFTGEEAEVIADNWVKDKTFVITGSLNHYPNRDALVALIESLGGKAGSGVTSKTSYLINNDITSTSGKNKKAKELGIPIITEEQFNEAAESGVLK